MNSGASHRREATIRRSVTAPPPLSRFEIASGMLFGSLRRPSPLPDVADDSPRVSLERELLPALLRSPCLVSFSGGRDSSAVLAAAVALARREGLSLPIAATNIFPTAPGTDEARWQEHVISHLGLTEWVRIEHTDELDLIGPYAQRVLRKHGLLWPCNVHMHLPLLDVARGGSLVTGVGGDELFAAARRLRASTVLSGAERPRPRDALTVGFAFAPARVRRRVIAHREPVTAEWLQPQARRMVTAEWAAETAAEPRKLRERLAWWQARRRLDVALAALELTAQDADVFVVHPLLSPGFWAAAGAAGAPHGFAGQTEGMRRLFGGLLPDEILARRSKAQFNETLWGSRSRAFAETWNGGGTPEEWVDRDLLARHWRGAHPSALSFTLMQAAWLASLPDRVQQAGEGVVE